jgi:tetratricopeptide (TPR) repeat protein
MNMTYWKWQSQWRRQELKALLHGARKKICHEDLAGALEDLDRAIGLAPFHDAALHYRGLVNIGLGSPGAALQDLDRALDLAPYNSQAWDCRVMAKLRLQNWAGAVEDLDRLFRKEPVTLRRLLCRATANENLQRWPAALEDLNRVLIMQPDQVRALVRRSVVLEELGDVGAAIQDVDRAVKLHPDKGQTDASCRWFDGHTMDDPPGLSPRAVFNLQTRRAVMRLQLQDNAGALDDLDALHEQAPDDAFVLKMRGLARSRSGDEPGALDDMQRSRLLDPEDPGMPELQQPRDPCHHCSLQVLRDAGVSPEGTVTVALGHAINSLSTLNPALATRLLGCWSASKKRDALALKLALLHEALCTVRHICIGVIMGASRPNEVLHVSMVVHDGLQETREGILINVTPCPRCSMFGSRHTYYCA